MSFERLRARSYRGAEIIVGLLLGSMFVTFLLQILFRYVLSLPVGWTVEWVTIAWLWGILFGYAFVVRDADVIRLDIIYAAMPDGVRRIMDIVTGLTCAGILIWTLPACLDYITFMHREKTAYLRWPFSIIFGMYLPFVVAVIIRSLLTVWRALRGNHLPAIQAESHDYD